MHPSAPRSSRSSIHSLAPSPTLTSSPSPSPSPSPSLTIPLTHQQQQQQQQHILYGPVTASQPCPTGLHPPCIYPANTQRSASASSAAPLHSQGKSAKWHGKSKVPRSQYCHGLPLQSTHLSYAGKPLLLYDQTQSAAPSSTSSFLVSSSTFAHGQFPSEHYNNSGVTLVPPPPYFKPPEVQTFCLVQDRQTAPQHNSYYNITSATNTCSLQAVNSTSGFQLPNLAPYAVAAFPNNQIAPPVPVQPTQIFQAGPIGLVFGPPPREKHTAASTLDISTPTKCIRSKHLTGASGKVHALPRLQSSEWPPSPACTMTSSSSAAVATTTAALSSVNVVLEGCKNLQNSSYNNNSTRSKQPEDHYSDESSVSFDFTIEAEKMVSALCNTASSNEFGGVAGKDEIRKTETCYFNGAGDNVANKGNWFADLAMNYSSNGASCRAMGTQTQPNQGFTRQLPELVRETAYWGCSEAETILNSSKYQESKQVWLSNICSATRTAITKSSTCFPVYAGDKTFMYDLINALLRITNSWLILDNYLNKQQYPNLPNKFDPELTRCFQDWEGNTYELLRNVVQTFLKLDEVNRSNFHLTSGSQNETQEGSFPGDVSLYTHSNIFCPPLTANPQQRWDNNFLSTVSPLQQNQESAYAVHYTPQSSGVQNFRYFNTQQNQKEVKPRSKWTITENLTSAVDGAKSVLDGTPSQTETNFGVSKFRGKASTSSVKGTSQQSLNVEFFNLRNKVMESSSDAGKQWNTNPDLRRKSDFLFGTKSSGGMDSVYNTNTSTGLVSAYSTKKLDTTHDVNTAKPCVQGLEPVFRNNMPETEPFYSGRSSAGGETNFSIKLRADTDARSKSLKCVNQNYVTKPVENGTRSVCLGKLSANQFESATVPKNKMTLLSQIEPSATSCKEPEGMAANLTAWFASMRTPNPTLSANSENRLSETFRSSHPPELSRSAIDLNRKSQMIPNRQLQTLQNMQSIQSAPWTAYNLMNNRSNVRQVDEYDSSEDVRVYMKPGSYNVPKKRHQRLPNRRTEHPPVGRSHGSNIVQNISTGTSIKLSFPPAPVVKQSSLSLENSPRILKRMNSLLSQEYPQDITWKAACASAEILLEALNVKEDDKGTIENQKVSSQMTAKLKCHDGGASSYEASEDDSGSTCKLSPSGVKSNENKINKTNVKTDSWLIRTLNNVSIKQRREPDLDSSESFNSSIHEDELVITQNSIEKLDSSLGRSQEPRDEDQAEDLTEGTARATYSETVRRSTSNKMNSKESCRSRQQKTTLSGTYGTGNLISTRKCQRKEGERSFLVHKLRKSIGKKFTKDGDMGPNDEGSTKTKLPKEETTRLPVVKGNTKKKDGGTGVSGENGKNKNGDRGWSVWYSSRRRQSLSPMATSKLESIHQTVWQMEEAEMFKYPPSSSMAVRSSAESIEDYCKVIKSPMFLETIGYKLKNKIYHKVEHVIRDFRKIIFNSRVYHKNDIECMAHIDILSKKLDNLFEEHFANWDFENITGSPREGNGSPVPSRYKLPAQKMSRSGNTKKSPSISTSTAENVGSLH